MLEAYKRMEANGVIGKMMKVDASGATVLNDIEGRVTGTLVVRPFAEFPKWIRRYRQDGSHYEVLVSSKNEELRLLAEDPQGADVPQSPLERERNDLAIQNSEYQRAMGEQEKQIAALQAQLSKLAAQFDRESAQRAALGSGDAAQRSAEVRSAPLPLGKK